MQTTERRQDIGQTQIQMRARLTEAQLRKLHELEYFGWTLGFVRHPPFQPPVPVLVAPRNRHVTLLADGTLDEAPELALRH